MLFHHHHHHLVFFCFIWTQTSEEKRKREQKKKREENKYLPRQTDRRTENQSTQQNKTENFLVKRKHIEHGEKKIVFFPKQNKKEKEKAHTGRLQSFVFLCASPKGLSGEIQKEKREENPTKTEENGVCIVVVVVSSPEDKAREKKTRERKKKTKQNQEHQTHIQNGMRNEEGKHFFWFFKSLQKSRRYKKEWNTHTHTHSHETFGSFFCIFFFSWVHFKRDRNYK